jgi:hypothetical protein
MQTHRRQASPAQLTVLAVFAALAGCDRAPPASQPAQAQSQAPAPTRVTPPPKPTYTLIITWMYGSQPPQTTQTVFHDQTACDQARDAAIAEGRRLALESFSDAPPTSPASLARAAPPVSRRYIGSSVLPTDQAAPAAPATASAPQSAPPKVAALCAATSAP